VRDALQLDPNAQIRLFGKLKLANCARPHHRAGFLIRGRLCAGCMAQAPFITTVICSGIVFSMDNANLQAQWATNPCILE
jgi:hypothetical protein